MNFLYIVSGSADSESLPFCCSPESVSYLCLPSLRCTGTSALRYHLALLCSLCPLIFQPTKDSSAFARRGFGFFGTRGKWYVLAVCDVKECVAFVSARGNERTRQDASDGLTVDRAGCVAFLHGARTRLTEGCAVPRFERRVCVLGPQWW